MFLYCIIVLVVIFYIRIDVYGNLVPNYNSNIPSYERQALYDLYLSTNGDDWIYQEGETGHWNFTDPNVNPCLDSNHWQGLLCTNEANMSNYTYISEILLSNYNLKGILPNSIGNFSQLQVLDLSYNCLTEILPSSLSKIKSIIIFDCSNNQLSGTIPYWIGTLYNLMSLNLAHNSITGVIPDNLSNLRNLTEVSLSNNLLIGSIPNIFSQLSKLKCFKTENNYLTNSIPTSVSKLRLLNSLFLQNNHLSGKLDDAINGSFQNFLSYIQLSNNQFTGKIPKQTFLSKSLIAFSAGSNCFHGSIPSNICENTKLEVFILDGLVSASSCRNKIIPGISTAYISENKINGGIPICLWSMPSLQILHLSGNGLTGSLPDSFKSSNLSDLSLSYNSLTGNIPTSFQIRIWNNLDLSHNRISGALSSDYTEQYVNGSLTLENNRLSGYIPNHLERMKNISILTGNYFNCKYDRSDLPIYDSYKHTFECGSNLFNALYYLWLGLFGTLLIISCFVWYYRNNLDNYFQITSLSQILWRYVFAIEYLLSNREMENNINNRIKSMLYFQQYENLNMIILRFSVYCTIFILIVLLPAYMLLTHYYGTHTYEYAWTVAIVYMAGETGFIVSMSLLILFVFLQICFYLYIIKNGYYNFKVIFKEQLQKDRKDMRVLNKDNLCKIYSLYIAYILVNLVVASGVNIIYIYVALYQSNSIVVLAQILLSIFKITWNNIISPQMVRWIIDNLSLFKINNNRIIYRRLFILQLSVSLFNNIIIPCFIVAAVSPNCFYNVFQQESEKSSSFTYKQCSIYNSNKTCYKYVEYVSTTSYKPPFEYHYQCSSDFIIYYSPVFVFICIISTFFIPFMNITMTYFIKNYKWFDKFPKLRNILNVDGLKLRNIGDLYGYLVSKLTFVGLLLTFGTVFPPLAVALLITICRQIFYHKAIIGRYLLNMINLKSYSTLDIMEDDCKSIPLLSTIGWMLIYTSCFFYTMFLFDILGDDVGLDKSYWVLITVPCIPLFLHMIYRLYKYNINIPYRDNNITNSTEVELQPVESKLSIVANPLLTIEHNCNNKENYIENEILDIEVSDIEDVIEDKTRILVRCD